MKYALKIAYDGSGHHGYQRQPNVITIQGEIERALATLLEAPVSLTAAGRTDKGVHALGQVVAFQTQSERPLTALSEGVNDTLDGLAAVLVAARLGDHKSSFHPRFSALERTYAYYLLARANPIDHLLWSDRAWCLDEPVDLGLMRSAVPVFLGKHDFTTFSFRGQGNKLRQVTSIDIDRMEPAGPLTSELYRIRITANSFLRKMVRLIVAGLVEVGAGLREVSDLKSKLEACDSTLAPHPAPSSGLYFESIHYDPDPFDPEGGLAQAVHRTRARHRIKFKP